LGTIQKLGAFFGDKINGGRCQWMRELDFEQHNEEVRQVWQAYREGKPIRVPVIFGINVRFTMWLPEANPRKITFEQYFSDPQIMLERQIEHIHWVRHNIPQDAEMGLPKDGWHVWVDFQNVYEAASSQLLG
jgi:hypothetical protein